MSLFPTEAEQEENKRRENERAKELEKKRGDFIKRAMGKGFNHNKAVLLWDERQELKKEILSEINFSLDHTWRVG